MSQIALYGGEKDGLIVKITCDRPDVFFALPNNAEEVIREAVGVQTKQRLTQELSTLAYQFIETVNRAGVGTEYRYCRAPQLDRKPSSGKIG